MKPRFSLKLAVLVVVVTLNATLETKNAQTQTLVVEQFPKILLNEVSTATISLETQPNSRTHQNMQVGTIPVGSTLAPVTIAAIPVGATITIFLIGGLIVIVVGAAIWKPRAILGLVIINQDEVGIVIKTLSATVTTTQLIALNGEAGPQAKTLSPGWHWWYWSWMYQIRREKPIQISSDEIGLVEAKDGAAPPRGRTFGQVVECNNFQDSKAFLLNGGQRGKQQSILTTGSYRINTELFTVRKQTITKIEAGEIGIVEAQDGLPLKPGQTFGREVACENFQDAKKFFEDQGQQGKQTNILAEGIYYINTELFKVRKGKLTNIEPGEIGLVEAKYGKPMPEGQQFGEVVADCEHFQDAARFLRSGYKGRQLSILRTGNYQINTDLFQVNKIATISISPDEIGLVEAQDGAPLETGQSFGRVVECKNFQDGQAFIKNLGQKGKQLAILRTGNYQINTALFQINKIEPTRIAPDEIGLVIATDGASLEPRQRFGKIVDCDKFQNAQAFVDNGGQVGKQRAILTEGVYKINTQLFLVRKEKLTIIKPGEIGFIEAQEGAPMEPGQSFGRVVECSNFQDTQAFFDNGGQKGKQLAILRTGNYQINSTLFQIRKASITKIAPHEIGLIEAQDGAFLKPGQTFGKVVDCHDFQDAEAFVNNGGQKGKQLIFLGAGNYQINTDLFTVNKIPVVEIPLEHIGLVEAKDGESLPAERSFGKVVDCNNFQNAPAFLANGGQEGKQLAILQAGSYQINTDLFKIRIVPMTQISPTEIGLVEARDGADLTLGKTFGKIVDCENFQNGQAFLDNGGQKGKQLAILTNGRYSINTDLFQVRKVSVIHISPEEIGLVEALDGAEPTPGKIFGRIVDCDNFQNPQKFFDEGGQRGKQLAILKAGDYYINTDLFQVKIVQITTIGSNEIGLVEAQDGAPLEQNRMFGQIIDCDHFQDPQQFFANGGQRGKQLAILQEGTYSINTELFQVRKESIVRIGPNDIRLVIANDGKSTEEGQKFGKVVDCDNFQDAQAFFENGGQKGKQLAILTTGQYRINTDLFTVVTPTNAKDFDITSEDLRVTIIEDDKIGIVTTHDGKALEGEIAGSVIPGHEKFQKPQIFIDNGGQQGLQEEILPAGRWNLNPWFVSVEQEQLTIIPNGHVGVIKSNIGKTPEHEDKLVDRGYKGIWKTPLQSRTYPINRRVQEVVIIPIKDLVLEWSKPQAENEPQTADEPKIHKHLPALTVHDKHGFSFDVEVTQIIRVRKENAPEMLCNVASTVKSIDELIREVLQPTVSNYFLNAAQEYEALDFQENRYELQAAAKEYIKDALKAYNIESVDTLILEIYLPDELTKLLRQRKLAEHQIEQFEMQTEVEKKRQQLTLEEERAKSSVQKAQEQLKAEIAAMQRQEELKAKEAKLDIDKKAHQAEIERLDQKSKVEADAKKRLDKVATNTERERKDIEVERQQALSKLNTEEMNIIEKLGREGYIQREELKASQQIELAKAILAIQQYVALQSTDVEKTKAIAQALGNQNILPNLQSIMGGEALEAVANYFGLPRNMLLNTLGQSNPHLYNQLGLAPLSFGQATSNPQLQSSKPPLPLNQSTPIIQPRCPVVLLLDTSTAMSGERIQHLNGGIVAFKQKVEQYPNLLQSLDLAIATFNSYRRTVQDFVPMNQFVPPQLMAEGTTEMGKGIESALQQVESYQNTYNNNHNQYHKPWLLLIMGSPPTDNWQQAAQLVRNAVETNQINFFVIGVQGADMTSLREISPPGRTPIMLDGLKFRELFHWLADALKEVANSKEGIDAKYKLPPITGWAQMRRRYQQ
ncbi:MAG: VWA domain-containing protein [Symploca sp. SIO2E6]|nr:VWA domain-containing protein [Symploca sp. SIO2E6]